jgi:hypothetical protein
MSKKEGKDGDKGEKLELMEDYLIPEYMLNEEKARSDGDNRPAPRYVS